MLICRITLCTDLCGSETCANMALFGRSKRDFLREFLALEHGIPSHDTFSRVFRLLDPARFHTWFMEFMRRFSEECQGVIMLSSPNSSPCSLIFKCNSPAAPP